MYQLFTICRYISDVPQAEGPQFDSEEKCKKYYHYRYVSTEARGTSDDYSWISKVNKDGTPKTIKHFRVKNPR